MAHGDLPHLLLNKYPSAIELKYILYHPIASCIPTSRCMSFAFRWLAKSNFGWIKKMHIRTISTVQYMPVLLLYPSSSISYITSHYPHLSVYIYIHMIIFYRQYSIYDCCFWILVAHPHWRFLQWDYPCNHPSALDHQLAWVNPP